MTFLEIASSVGAVLDFSILKIAQTHVTLRSLITFVIIIAVFIVVSKWVNKILTSRFFTRLKMEEGTRYALSRILHYTIVTLGTIVGFQAIGIDLSGLLVIFGFLSVGIGFGLQNITSNFISGLILLFERPIRVGDRVTVGDTEGDVTEINMRSTTIRTVNNISYIVPNAEFISGTVINWSHGDPKVRLDIPVGVSYDSNLDTVIASLLEVAEATPKVLRRPAAGILFESFGDSAWNMNLRVWIDRPQHNREIRSEINCAIVRKFREKKIDIPFPQRDLHFRSPLPFPLGPRTTPARAPEQGSR